MAFYAAFYRGTHSGLPGVYNWLVRKWERGLYSHVELVFSDGMSASSSFMDGGVRFKYIRFNSTDWDIIPLPSELEAAARQYFTDHEGWSYDLMGNVNQVIGFVPQAKRKLFCSEAVGEALGIPECWRFGPNSLACIFRSMFAQLAR